MANKPPILCRLETGKLIDVQKHFVDTFNWLVDFAANLKGVSGIEVKGIDKGKPEVSLLLEAGDGIVIKADETSGKLKISAKQIKLEAGDNIEIDEDEEKGVFTISAKAGEKYIKGSDTNIVFTPTESGTAIDVYYS